jgi:two-component system, chemotaxis family, response regulator Rcp1
MKSTSSPLAQRRRPTPGLVLGLMQISEKEESTPARVLLIEDNLGDVRLMREVLLRVNNSIHLLVALDGVEAMAFLNREMVFLNREGNHVWAPRPDLILLDLNLPKMDGREVLAKIKTDASLRIIPLIVLTTSNAEADIAQSYELHANCYLRKPQELNEFERLVKSINDFWLSRVKLPQPSQAAWPRTTA